MVAPQPDDPCRLSAASADTPETLTVVAGGDQFLLRHRSETLVRVDCNGVVRPGLASEWARESSGRAWLFTTRSKAADVVSTWRDRQSAAEALGIDSVAALDDHRLRVTLRTPLDSVARLFADPALALPGENTSSVHIRMAPDVDPRDAIDHGADLVVTRDPALVDYVSSRNAFVTFPLPWSRTYVLLEAGDHEGELGSKLSDASVRSSLARDAVRAGARASEPPYWWIQAACEATSAARPSTVSSRVVYRNDDEVARGLAERIVALAPAGARLRAAGLDTAEFAAALSAGNERAYVLGVPRQSLAPCRDAARWLAGIEPFPLIDTRAYAIVRRGTPPLTVDWDGTPRVEGP